jgi:CRP/FNR family transcriptional regulator, cyclic AMP receptor protein
MSASPFDLLQWLPERACEAFHAAARGRRFGHGELIYSQGDPGNQMYRLVSGAVRLSVARSDGRELLYLLFQPGDCFGTSSLVDGEMRPQTAEAHEACEVEMLGRVGFDQLRSMHREFDDALIRLATRHMRLLSGLFADAHLEAISARVASRILATARSFGRPTPAGIALSVPLTQSELALMVGGSRQTVNKVLQQFQADGLVNLSGGQIIVLSKDRLRSMLSSE